MVPGGKCVCVCLSVCIDGTDPEIPLYEDNAYAWYLGVSVCECVCLSVLTELIRRSHSMRIMLMHGTWG